MTFGTDVIRTQEWPDVLEAAVKKKGSARQFTPHNTCNVVHTTAI
jgi:hypothetical protein